CHKLRLKGQDAATKVRELGNCSGNKGIESIAVDDQLVYVYYSDEGAGGRKYYANPDSSNIELAMFATSGFMVGHKGISIYNLDEEKGYIVVSACRLITSIFSLEREPQKILMTINWSRSLIPSTLASDRSEVTHRALNSNFPEGLFVAMSDDRTFHYYSWRDT